MSEFEKSLNKFLEKETYIVAYRSNYDSAREFNNELINYIKDLQQENQKLKGVIETYEILIKANNINNWNELKKWLEEYKEYCELEIKKGIALHTYDELDRNKRYGDITTCLYKVCNKMQELENRKV